MSWFEQKTTVVHREPVATDGVGLVLDFHLKVAQTEGFLGDPDNLENLGWTNAVVEVVGAPELQGDHLLTAFGTAAVDVVFARLAYFGDVKVRGNMRSVGKDEDDLLKVSEGLFEFWQLHDLVNEVPYRPRGVVSTGKGDGASLYAGFYGLAFERAGCLIGKGMKVLRRIALSLCLALAGCSDEETGDEVGKPGAGALERSKKIRELEKSLERLRWENTRLSLKMKSVGGGSLVRDKVTGLWHHDVEREPFTGRALEKFPGGSQRAEADFLNGKKDGMERFWHANGRLKSEGQWFDGRRNGVFREWREDGKPISANRFKNGQLIENLAE